MGVGWGLRLWVLPIELDTRTPEGAAGQGGGVGFRLVTIRGVKNQTQRGEASLACGPWRSAWRVSTRPASAPDWKVREGVRVRGQAVTDRAREPGVEGAVAPCPAEHRGGLAPWTFSWQEGCVQGRDRTLSRGVSLPLIPCGA